MDISVLGLPVKLHNTLWKKKIRTVDQLKARLYESGPEGEPKLLFTRGIGVKSMEQIYAAIKKHDPNFTPMKYRGDTSDRT